MELGRRQQFNTNCAVVSRSDLIKRFEINLKVAQDKVAWCAKLFLQFKRAIKIAGPDIESAVLIGDLNRVIDDNTVNDVHANMLNLNLRIRVEVNLFDTPVLPVSGGHRHHVVKGRGCNHNTICVRDICTAGQTPAAVIIQNPVVQNNHTAIHDLGQIRGLFTVFQRLRTGRRRPHLL